MTNKSVFAVMLSSSAVLLSSGIINSAMADTSTFISDSKTDITLSNNYIHLIDTMYPDYSYYDMTAWGQAISVDFQSGYINDMFGLDLSLYGVDDLKAAEGFATRGYFRAETDSSGNTSAHGFTKVPQYLLKQKFQVGDMQLSLFEGMRYLQDFGVLSTEDRIIHSSYYGVTSELENTRWLLKAGYLSRYSDTDTPNKEVMLTKDGKDIDYVYTGDLTYRSDDWSARYYYGESQDYLRRQVAEYSYNWDRGKTLSARYFYNQGLENWKNLSDFSRFYDNDASHFTLEARMFSPEWFIKAGYTYSRAAREYSLGRFDWNMSDNSLGNQDSMAHGLSTNFTNDGEHVLGIIAIRNITPEIKAGFVARYGFGMEYKGNHMNESEVGLIGAWTPEAVKGLSINVGGGPNYSFKRGYDNTPLLNSDGQWQQSTGYCFTASVKYTF
ncbi:hypothetical protein C4K68_07945 [Pokkaliibacter plantistimulans]|uniref:Outer membrane porin, OprD family n=1 Tax=Proteobacteria bacterium 228 TaxID=2083153 RepID=A0A2S5KSY5_9PROT|nr:OprD family outer membrane porin [Pokkaliibacter plantistimulans]PPC77967.1 hypothetical protein C4K68_07945 [Pokkaliibacter plantistimulans]